MVAAPKVGEGDRLTRAVDLLNDALGLLNLAMEEIKGESKGPTDDGTTGTGLQPFGGGSDQPGRSDT